MARSTSGWDRRPSPTRAHPPGPLNMDCSCLAPLPDDSREEAQQSPWLTSASPVFSPGLSLTFPQQGGWEKRPQPAFFLRVKLCRKKFGEKLLDYRETGGKTAGDTRADGDTAHSQSPPFFICYRVISKSTSPMKRLGVLWQCHVSV